MPITLLTLQEAAERYGIAVEQLRDYVRDGRMSLVAMGDQELVSDDEVRKMAGGNGNRVHWIALQDAARQYALSDALLERLAKDGAIRSGILEDELHLAIEDVEPIAGRLSRENFRKLEGTPIELARAVEQYGIPFRSLLTWARRGYIRTIKSPRRRPVLLNEADVAYTKTLAEIRGVTKGKALFPSSPQYSPIWLYE